MKSVKMFLDLYFDFMVFVFGLAFIMAGFFRIGILQREQKAHAVSEMQSLVYSAELGEEEYTTGAEIVSYLLGDDAIEVVYEDEHYGFLARHELIEELTLDGQYLFVREYGEDNASAPLRIKLEKIGGENGT